MELPDKLQLADGTTLIEIELNIRLISNYLVRIGEKLFVGAEKVLSLKEELYQWEENQKADIRSKEDNGYLILKDGKKIKLTDETRKSLARFGKLKQFAEYEALKREQNRLDSAVKALAAALTGSQSLAKILMKELENL